VAETITIIDDRTGKKVTVPLRDGVFPSTALRELDPDLRMYDPAFLSTAACASSITYIDGDAGILRYRGYPIEQLAEKSTYLEVAYLLLNGELPSKTQLEKWNYDVIHHTMIHENMRKRFVDGFHYDAHPMGMFVSAVAALGTFYPESKDIFDPASLEKQILRLIAKVPTLAAMCYRFSSGLPVVSPNNSMSYPENFLNMMFRLGDDHTVDPRLTKAMDLLFMLHADHEGGNVSAHATHLVGSALSDPYYAWTAGLCGLAGPLHGLANQECLRWLEETMEWLDGREPTVALITEYTKATLAQGKVIPGYGHAVLRKTDPRFLLEREFAQKNMRSDPMVRLVDICYQAIPPVLEATGKVKNPWPNVDAHSGVCMKYYGLKEADYYTVVFAVSRALGVTSQFVWSRVLGLPIERPKSVTVDWLAAQAAKKK
jgi:citrate synthase